MLAWVWIGVVVAAIVIEILTERLVSICFAPGAAVAAVLDFLDFLPLVQIIVVFVSAALGILFVETYLKKKLCAKRANINSIVGERCVVTERIDNYAGSGHVRVKGQVWSARGVGDDDVFETGAVLRVVALEGVKVICRK